MLPGPTRMTILVIGIMLFSIGAAQKDGEMKEAIASRSKKLAEESEGKTLAEIRRREAEAEEEEAKEMRRREAEEENKIKAKTEQEEAIIERDLAKAQPGGNGPVQMMDVVAELALHLAELQRKLDVNDVEAQEMKQRLQETEGRLKETEGRLKATERHIKRQQTNWKRTGLTLDTLKSHRQRGEEALKTESVKGKASSGENRQNEAIVKNKTLQEKPVGVAKFLTWILETETKIQATNKKLLNTDNTVLLNVNKIQATNKKLQNTDNKQQMVIASVKINTQGIQTNAGKIQDLGEKLEGKRCETGLADSIANTPIGVAKTVSVTFRSPFKTVPKVLVAPYAAYNYDTGVGSGFSGAGFIMTSQAVTTTGFTVVYDPLSEKPNAFLRAAYIACS